MILKSFLRILFWLVKILYHILMPQSFPMNPCGQLQENELTPSTQTPSFLQGVDAQSSISMHDIQVFTTLLKTFLIMIDI